MVRWDLDGYVVLWLSVSPSTRRDGVNKGSQRPRERSVELTIRPSLLASLSLVALGQLLRGMSHPLQLSLRPYCPANKSRPVSPRFVQLVLYIRRFGRSDATSLRITVGLMWLFTLLHDMEVWAIGVTK